MKKPNPRPEPLPAVTVSSLPAIKAEIEEGADRLRRLRKLVRDFEPPTPVTPVDTLATIRAEIAEGADLLRPHYPDANEEELRDRATSLLRERYKTGHWPAAEEIKAKAVRGIAKASADVIDWGAEYARRNGR